MRETSRGRLIYLIGPSGSGKDSLIHYVRSALANEPDFQVAHRYITRPACRDGENHQALSESEFFSRQEAGLFAMQWQAHNFHYGIGLEINQWLCRGVTVLVNGSRAYLPQAYERYPDLLLVRITVQAEEIRQRLLRREREDCAEVEERLARNEALEGNIHGGLTLDNSGPIHVAGDQLKQLIQARLALESTT